MQNVAGDRLIYGRYRLRQSLGRGSFGEVFMAEDIQFDPPRIVALKLLHPQYISEDAVRESIKQEASVLARFDHPNILRVIDFAITSELAFIVTDMAVGGSLARKLRPDPTRPPVPMPLPEAAGFLEQMADALDEAHAQGLVHRDIKPQNILIDRRGRPLIADFGLATAVASSASSVLVDTSTSGTPLYMAPEQWQGRAGRSSDIYALGAVLFQMVSGQPPYGGNQFELFGQHMHAPIPRLAERAPGLVYPPALDEVIALALAKDPHHRIRPAKELARRFRQAVAQPGVFVSPLQPTDAATPVIERNPPAQSGTTNLSQGAAFNQALFNQPGQTLIRPSGPPTAPVTGTRPYQPPAAATVSRTAPEPPPAPEVARRAGSGKLVAGLVGMVILLAGLIALLLVLNSQKKENTPLAAVTTGASTTASPTTGASTTSGLTTAPVVITTSAQTTPAASTAVPTTAATQASTTAAVTTAATQATAVATTAAAQTTAVVTTAAPQTTRPVTTPARTTPPPTPPPYVPPLGTPLFNLNGHEKLVLGLAYSPDSRTLASGADDSTVRLWDLAAKQERAVLKEHTGPVRSVAYSPDGTRLASASADGTVRLWDTSSNKVVATLRASVVATSVAWSPDGKRVAVGYDDKQARVWNVETGTATVLAGHRDPVISVAYSPDGTRLATAGADRTIRLWNTANNTTVLTLTGHTNWIWSVAWSPDGKLLASASFDQTVRLWNTATGQTVQTLSGHLLGVRGVAFSRDGKVLASSSDDRSLRFWEVAGGKPINSVGGHTAPIYSLAFAPDNQSLATGSEDKSIKVWAVGPY